MLESTGQKFGEEDTAERDLRSLSATNLWPKESLTGQDSSGLPSGGCYVIKNRT